MAYQMKEPLKSFQLDKNDLSISLRTRVKSTLVNQLGKFKESLKLLNTMTMNLTLEVKTSYLSLIHQTL
jgi:hypothetical protein